MLDHLDAPFFGYGNPCNCVSTLNNGVPSQVQIMLGTNVSERLVVVRIRGRHMGLNRRLTLSPASAWIVSSGSAGAARPCRRALHGHEASRSTTGAAPGTRAPISPVTAGQC
jgi:hypothetical protein